MKTVLIFTNIFLILTCYVHNSFAFDFIPERCSVYGNEKVTFKIDDFTFDSEVHFELFFDTMGLPQARVYFLEHEPVNVSIQWNSITSQRSGKNLFTPTVSEQIQLQASRPLPLSRNADATIQPIFETKSTDLIQLQSLVVLFISQNDLIISVESDDGNIWNGSFSLSNSDLSYRQMASRCFTQKSSLFLGINATRLPSEAKRANESDFAEAVSTGYGLANYIDLLNLIPTFNTTIGLPTLSPESVGPLLSLLEQKKSFLGQSNETLTNQDDVNEAIKNHDNLVQKQTALFSKLQQLSGDRKLSIPGLIETKKKEQAEITNSISLIEQNIQKLNSNQVEFSTAQKQVLEELSPFLPKLEIFKNDKQELNSQISMIQSFLDDLLNISESYAKILTENNVPFKTAQEQLGTPWSLEEIKKKDKENAKWRQQYLLVQKIKDQLLTLKAESQSLVQAAQRQDQSAQIYLDSVDLKQKLTNELQQLENLIIKETQIPFYSDIDEIGFSIMNSQLEETFAGSSRDYENEFTAHENAFNSLREQYIQTIKMINEKQRNLFVQIICDPNIILNPQSKTKPCLNFDEISNEKTRNTFVENLSPVMIDELIEQTPKPWPLAESKVDFLIKKINQDVTASAADIEGLSTQWSKIRLTIWRWATLQKDVSDFNDCNNSIVNQALTDGIYSAEFYDNAFLCEKKRHQGHINTKEEVFQKSIEQTLLIAETKAAYEIAEKEFSAISQVFSQKVNTLVEDSQNQVLLTDIYGQCLLPLENPEECAHSFDVQLQRQIDFENFANELHLQVNARMTLYKEESELLKNKIATLEQQEAAFIEENNLRSLFEQKELLVQKLEQLKRDLIAEQESFAKMNESLSLVTKESERLASEEAALLAKMALVSLDLEKQRTKLTSSCAQIKEMQNQQATIDLQIMEILGQQSSAAERSTSQEFSFLRVLRFCQ
jgi:hypothetical protein